VAARRRRAAAAGVLGLMLGLTILVAPRSALAQTGQTAQIPLQFDFLNPGARSLGLGSTFVAIADDATAAFTNPAGLTLGIRTLEVSAEFRYRTLQTPYLSGGRLSGTPTGEGLDTVASPVYGVSSDAAVRPYFFSVAYPRSRVAIAVFRHELVRQSNAFVSQGPFYKAGGIFNESRLFGLSGNRTIDLVTYGVSTAYRVSSRLSLGEGLSLYRLSLRSRFAALGFLGDAGPVDISTAGQGSRTTQDGTGTQVAFDIGALVTVNRAVRAGVVFRQSATFRFSEVNVVPGEPTLSRVGTFHTPGVVGVGVAYQPNGEWSLGVDYDRVQYSHLTDTFVTIQVDPAVADRVSVASGNEWHLGAEYTFTRTTHKLSLRAGAWWDPDHAVRYVSDGSRSDADTRLQAVFSGGDSVWHYCLGAGLPLSRSLEMNVGADLTTGRRYASGSIIARFGR
jgi:long-subunit fatty acid transport protein